MIIPYTENSSLLTWEGIIVKSMNIIIKRLFLFTRIIIILVFVSCCDGSAQPEPQPNPNPSPSNNDPLVADASYPLFFRGDGTNSNFFRIPALCTLSNGTVIAAIDGRMTDPSDSPNNIELKIKTLELGSDTWQFIDFSHNFKDHANEHPNAPGTVLSSASFIDPCIAEDTERGRTFLMIDAFPWNSGVLGGNAVAGSGLKTINGIKYLALTDGEAIAANDRSMANFRHTVREGDIIWHDPTNTPTEYMVNSRFEVLQKVGDEYQPLYVNQLLNNSVSVPMNVFYQRSLFRVLRTSYLFMFYSDDYGQTWSDPINLNYLKKDDEVAWISGCSRGLQLKTGNYKGRVMFPVYNLRSTADVVYTDDGGETWKRSTNMAGVTGQSNISITEAELVEMPEGHVAMFARTPHGFIALTYSYTGGETWARTQNTPLLNPNCNISAISYSRTIDGKYAIFVSYPNSETRRENGTITAGLVSITGRDGENNPVYSIDWKKRNLVFPGRFGYSSLTEMPDSRIAMLAEEDGNFTRTIFSVFSVDKLVSGEIGTTNVND